MSVPEDSDFLEESIVTPFENPGQEPPTKSTPERKRRLRFEEMYTVVGGQYVMPLDEDEGFP